VGKAVKGRRGTVGGNVCEKQLESGRARRKMTADGSENKRKEMTTGGIVE